MNRKAFVIVVLSLILLAVLGGGILWCFHRVTEEISRQVQEQEVQAAQRQAEAEKQAEEARKLEEATSIDTSSWKTYRNEKYGFEVKYPSDIYKVEEDSSGYVALTSFVAITRELKEKHGDIQVLYEEGTEQEGTGPFNQKDITENNPYYHPINLDGKKIYFSEEESKCGAGVGYCSVPGEAFIFAENKSYNIRRITFHDAKYPLPKEGTFIQFLVNFKPL